MRDRPTLRETLETDHGLIRCPPVFLPIEVVREIKRHAERYLPTVNAARKALRERED